MKLLIVFLISIIRSEGLSVADHSEGRRIEKRGLFVPWLLYGYNAATGIVVAISIPLHELDRNVFVSYNFEGNYNMPNQPSDSFPGPPFTRWQLGSTYQDMSVNPAGDASPDDSIARNLEENREVSTEREQMTTEASELTRKRRSSADEMFTTRKGTYRLIESRIQANGFNGKKCLLRAICESAQNSLIESNGILGHILHIIFTPSTSLDEHMPSEYSKAENLGNKGNCQKYTRRCDFSLLDAISKLV